MSRGRTILQNERFGLTLERLSHQLIENYNSFDNTCLIGIQERGVYLADRIRACVESNVKGLSLPTGKLDITFYRDDFRTRSEPLKASDTDIEFSLEGKKVVLIDDVLYSGRTVQAAMAAIQDFGRPDKVELLAMVDRRFNRQLPIQCDYTGITVDALDHAYVKVEFDSIDGQDRILLFSPEREVE